MTPMGVTSHSFIKRVAIHRNCTFQLLGGLELEFCSIIHSMGNYIFLECKLLIIGKSRTKFRLDSSFIWAKSSCPSPLQLNGVTLYCYFNFLSGWFVSGNIYIKVMAIYCVCCEICPCLHKKAVESGLLNYCTLELCTVLSSLLIWNRAYGLTFVCLSVCVPKMFEFFPLIRFLWVDQWLLNYFSRYLYRRYNGFILSFNFFLWN